MTDAVGMALSAVGLVGVFTFLGAQLLTHEDSKLDRAAVRALPRPQRRRLRRQVLTGQDVDPADRAVAPAVASGMAAQRWPVWANLSLTVSLAGALVSDAGPTATVAAVVRHWQQVSGWDLYLAAVVVLGTPYNVALLVRARRGRRWLRRWTPTSAAAVAGAGGIAVADDGRVPPLSGGR